MEAWIDGDILVYSCGSAADIRYYEVQGRVFDYKKEAVTYCEENEIPLDTIEFKREANPVQYSLGNVKGLLNSILQSVEPTGGRIFLTGKGNYREEMAVTKPYKGQRKESAKPIWFNEIREYLVNQWGAEIVDKREADDAIGCRHYELWSAGVPSCIVTTDKDLNMIPGLHYDWTKETFRDISLAEADYFFYKQLLTGDSTDNITGCPNIGPKKAEKVLAETTTPYEMWQVVKQKYTEVLKEDESTVLDYLLEQVNLLWIQREDNKFWVPPRMEDNDG